VFCFLAEDGIRDSSVTGVQTCALPISGHAWTAGPGMTGTLDQNSADEEPGGSAVVGARDGSSVGCRLGERRLEARASQRLQRLRSEERRVGKEGTTRWAESHCDIVETV